MSRGDHVVGDAHPGVVAYPTCVYVKHPDGCLQVFPLGSHLYILSDFFRDLDLASNGVKEE